MLTYDEIARQIPQLTVEERKRLLDMIADTLSAPPAQNQHSLLELEGLGKEIWQGIDAQEYVSQLRSEWDHRP
jgi:hypothetical protein